MEDEYKFGLAVLGVVVFFTTTLVISGEIRDTRQNECVIKSQEIGKFSVLEIKELCGGK